MTGHAHVRNWQGISQAVAATTLLLLAHPAHGQSPCDSYELCWAPEPVTRVDYRSASGVYSLRVDATTEKIGAGLAPGWGSARYSLTRDGTELWLGTKPYTLRGVTITNDGIAAGFAYRDVHRLLGDCVDVEQYYHVVILDQQGKERLNEVSERHRSRVYTQPDLPSRPYARQLLLDPDHDRLIVRVVEDVEDSADLGEIIGGRPAWRVYRLSTGDFVEEFDPSKLRVKRWHRPGIYEMQLVAGTPLLLVHLSMVGPPPDATTDRGGRFVLLERDWTPVWSLDVPADYNEIHRKRPEYPLQCFFVEHPAILKTEESRCFRLRLFVENKCASFCVEPQQGDGWSVRETERTDYVSPPN